MRKDVGLALSEMKQIGETLPNLIQTEKLYAKANENKALSQEDFTAIIKLLETSSS